MDGADLAFAGLARHAELIAAGEVSSRALTELFLGRIERLDPVLNAFRLVLGERALQEADAADARRAEGRPLNGVPIAIKDDVHIAGVSTAYGCDADPQPQPADSEVVARLRAAGAVILGKTHVPEMMATPFTESPTFGVTRNPWDPHRTSGGSSGGPPGPRPAGRAPPAGPGRRRRRGACAARRWGPTAPARCASRRRAARCSASSRSGAVCPPRPRSSRTAGCPSTGRPPATCLTPPC